MDDTRVGAHAVFNNPTIIAPPTFKGAGMDAQNVTGDGKICLISAVPDAKMAANDAETELKKAEI